ncbi:hypothetical protein CLIB1423_05S01134 [[Candida] railenensis]|uniref:Uncharacterized protein n=1 Tax=[Candida] railenensis TaxID=45579 RepID=A0A9P0QNP6_9ASCO|nr:hypothetical protein CLIB1423_05S01134 [[Candida] railenensis]
MRRTNAHEKYGERRLALGKREKDSLSSNIFFNSGVCQDPACTVHSISVNPTTVSSKDMQKQNAAPDFDRRRLSRRYMIMEISRN